MGRILKLLASRSFAILLFHLGLFFFIWPILSIPVGKGGEAVFNYVFIVWAILVFALLLIGISIRVTGQDAKGGKDV